MLPFADPAKKVVHYNPKYEDMYAPIAGPAHPFSKDGLAAGQRNHKIGHVEVRYPRPQKGTLIFQSKLSKGFPFRSAVCFGRRGFATFHVSCEYVFNPVPILFLNRILTLMLRVSGCALGIVQF
jgi:hypothetical protein